MNRKLSVLVVFVVLLLGVFIGCKKKMDSTIVEPEIETTTEKIIVVKDVLDYMEQQKWNSVNIQFDFKLSEEKYIHTLVLWQKNSNSTGRIDISADFYYQNIKSEKMAHVTTIYYQNNEFYLNQKEICDYIIALDEQFISITGFFKKLGDYVLITPQDIAKILDQNGMRQEEIILLRFFNQTEAEKIMQIREIIAQIENFVIEFGENNEYFDLSEERAVLDLNANNFEAICKKIKNCNTSKYYESILHSGNNKDLESGFTNKYVSKMKKCEEQMIYNFSQIKEWNGMVSFGVSSENITYVMGEYVIKDFDENGKFRIDFKQTELQEYVQPEKYVNFSEFMKIYERVQKFLGFLS